MSPTASARRPGTKAGSATPSSPKVEPRAPRASGGKARPAKASRAASPPKAKADADGARGGRPRVAAKAPRGDAAQAILEVLRGQHPDAHCELLHDSAWTLLVATVLSAQATDKLVNKITPDLFRSWPAPADLAAAEPAIVAEFLRSRGMGFHNVKGKNIVGLAQAVRDRHGGAVPRTMSELVKLPGVGRKTANLILGECFGGGEGVVVDTHVLRLSQRLGLSKSDKAEPMERDLGALFRPDQWVTVSHTLIFHGRRVCLAVRPACASCAASQLCPSAYDAVHVGRK